MDVAKNAERALKQICTTGFMQHDGTPNTLVYKLVIDIEKLTEDQDIQNNLKFRR